MRWFHREINGKISSEMNWVNSCSDILLKTVATVFLVKPMT